MGVYRGNIGTLYLKEEVGGIEFCTHGCIRSGAVDAAIGATSRASQLIGGARLIVGVVYVSRALHRIHCGYNLLTLGS